MQWEIIANYRVLRHIRICKKKTSVAKYFGMHRNSVNNCIKCYEKHKTPQTEELLNEWKHVELNEIIKHFSFFTYESRKPHFLRWVAPPKIESIVEKEYEKLWYWYRRMYKHLCLQHKITKQECWLWAMKWIYKRKWRTVKKVRTVNKERRNLYNYSSISPFEYLHYDVKHILDQSALSQDIYDKFKNNNDLPKYQRTIIDAKSRRRFLAYSHTINATFWFYFLQFVLMFLRDQRIEHTITIWFDWWSEFCSWSAKKVAEWNNKLSPLNCKVYQYDWSRDVRKNLIERSHKTDDEEFYNPRWEYIQTKKDFVYEAHNWFLHYNTTRIHTWICMDTTPLQKIHQSWLWKISGFASFPTLILEDCIDSLMYNWKTIALRQSILLNSGVPTDYKKFIDFQVELNILDNKYAQNVLYHYQIQEKSWEAYLLH